ncbi:MULTISPECIES: hypothetical protein [unclassified Mesorhizobium]|uniref:hypothetical protein n=1 Tax=unclassified Mesorhizobium TaxID=325217 RepID=UPI001FE077BE|nr:MULTISPECIES: hypothetical protein [unclassified Mesorhizobium]
MTGFVDRQRAAQLMDRAGIEALVLCAPEAFHYATGASIGPAGLFRRAGAGFVVIRLAETCRSASWWRTSMRDNCSGFCRTLLSAATRSGSKPPRWTPRRQGKGCRNASRPALPAGRRVFLGPPHSNSPVPSTS